jgi:glucosamine--fructose-6-phosphate aminotransferase (isomerizing)
MCGIVGYLGKGNTLNILIESLKRLEYRGYDSAGIAVFHGGKIEIRRCQGKIWDLECSIRGEKLSGQIGVGHTRWATHGRPSEENAHPHKAGRVVVVHNGIIENYLSLKEILIKEGRHFTSETDSEIIAHLIDKYAEEGMGFEAAVRKAMKRIKGSYAIAVLYEGDPSTIIAVRKESPLIIGVGEEDRFIASDIPAILKYTRKMIFLEDEEMAILSPKGVKITTLEGKQVKRDPKVIQWDPVLVERGGYKHFMLKEIHEQPRAAIDTIRGRISLNKGDVFLEEIQLTLEVLKALKRVVIIACGTSWHAALVGKFMLEELCRIPVEVDLGSEFRYRDPILDKGTLLILISQSGETADTLAALREGKKKKVKCLSICNVVDSSLTRGSDGIIYTRAGPEIGVASTKAFTTQLIALYLFSLHLAKVKGRIEKGAVKGLLKGLVELPHLMEKVLNREDEIEQIAKRYVTSRDFLYLARGINYPIALEGALKLKEISYIHAEGYPAGEMKHGPIALIDEDMPVVVLFNRDKTSEKVLSNMEEVKARGGKLIVVTTEKDRDVLKKADDFITIPKTNPLLAPALFAISLQLFAYHMAVLRGTDVDQPRNLAKSVTVE